jgi:hypothetical protein
VICLFKKRVLQLLDILQTEGLERKTGSAQEFGREGD